MKKLILLSIGVLCMYTCQPLAQAGSEDPVRYADVPEPRFIFKNHQDFINLKNCGFSVSVDGPNVVIKCEDVFFTYHDGQWYIANELGGPWVLISETALPAPVREHGSEGIRMQSNLRTAVQTKSTHLNE